MISLPFFFLGGRRVLGVARFLGLSIRASPCGDPGVRAPLCGLIGSSCCSPCFSAPCCSAPCSAPCRSRSPLGPLARRSCPAGSLSVRPDPPQGPGARCPPRVASPANHIGIRRPPPGLGCRAPPRVDGGSPADARCGKRLLHQRASACVPALLCCRPNPGEVRRLLSPGSDCGRWGCVPGGCRGLGGLGGGRGLALASFRPVGPLRSGLLLGLLLG